MPVTLVQKAKRLRARAKALCSQASIIEKTMAEQTFEASPYEIGEVVEGWTWVGRIKPIWKVGTIIKVWWGVEGECCVTLEFLNPGNRERRAGYFLSSIRKKTDGFDMRTPPCTNWPRKST